jgi:hypothetical protein
MLHILCGVAKPCATCTKGFLACELLQIALKLVYRLLF